MKGLTYNEVKSLIQGLAEKIPATEEQCESYTVSYAPASDTKGDRHPDVAVLHAKLHDLNIQLKVEYYELVSEPA